MTHLRTCHSLRDDLLSLVASHTGYSETSRRVSFVWSYILAIINEMTDLKKAEAVVSTRGGEPQNSFMALKYNVIKIELYCLIIRI